MEPHGRLNETDWVELLSTAGLDADIVRGMLRSHGLRVVGRTEGTTVHGSGAAVQLLVHPDDLAEARSLVADGPQHAQSPGLRGATRWVAIGVFGGLALVMVLVQLQSTTVWHSKWLTEHAARILVGSVVLACAVCAWLGARSWRRERRRLRDAEPW